MSEYNCIIVHYINVGNKRRYNLPVWQPICSISCAKKSGHFHWQRKDKAEEEEMERKRKEREEIDLVGSLYNLNLNKE